MLKDLRFRVWDLGFLLGFRLPVFKDLGFRVKDLGFRAFRVLFLLRAEAQICKL